MEDRSESDVQLLLSAREVFSVDDLCTGRGVVLGRAATTLRSIETQPFDWMICSCQLDKSSDCRGLWLLRAMALGFVHFSMWVFSLEIPADIMQRCWTALLRENVQVPEIQFSYLSSSRT